MRRSSPASTLLVARVHLERARHHITGDVGRHLRQPVADEAGDRLGAGRIGGTARMRDAAITLAAVCCRRNSPRAGAQRVEEIAERGALQGPRRARRRRCAATASCARPAGAEPPTARITRLTSASAARVDEVAQLEALLGPRSKGGTATGSPLSGPLPAPSGPRSERHRSRQLGRIDSVDERRFCLRVEPRG